MRAFFCPGCWQEFRTDVATCPHCGFGVHKALKKKDFVDRIILTLRHPEREKAIRAARLLGQWRESKAVEPLGRLLAKTQDAYHAGEIVAALGKIDTPEARSALKANANHPAQMVRWEVRRTLGRMGIDVPPPNSERTAEPEQQEAARDVPQAPRPAIPTPLSALHAYTGWPFDEAEAKRRQQETARALGIPVQKRLHLKQGVAIRMVLIPAGEFDMGSPPTEAGRGDHETLHRVRITMPFYMGKYPVTQEQWQVAMGSNPSYFQASRNPVDQVSWEDCQAFLKEVNARAGRDLLALPTEAQWEYACRAGARTRFPFGDSESGMDKYAWYSAGFGEATRPIGATPPNAWGLHDMADYLGEWCADWYEEKYYAISPEDDPAGPECGRCRVVRGCSWYPIPRPARSACRRWAPPTYRFHDIGFRVASCLDLGKSKGETDGKNDCVRASAGDP